MNQETDFLHHAAQRLGAPGPLLQFRDRGALLAGAVQNGLAGGSRLTRTLPKRGDNLHLAVAALRQRQQVRSDDTGLADTRRSRSDGQATVAALDVHVAAKRLHDGKIAHRLTQRGVGLAVDELRHVRGQQVTELLGQRGRAHPVQLDGTGSGHHVRHAQGFPMPVVVLLGEVGDVLPAAASSRGFSVVKVA
jgi:hypothetical protein